MCIMEKIVIVLCLYIMGVGQTYANWKFFDREEVKGIPELTIQLDDSYVSIVNAIDTPGDNYVISRYDKISWNSSPVLSSLPKYIEDVIEYNDNVYAVGRSQNKGDEKFGLYRLGADIDRMIIGDKYDNNDGDYQRSYKRLQTHNGNMYLLVESFVIDTVIEGVSYNTTIIDTTWTEIYRVNHAGFDLLYRFNSKENSKTGDFIVESEDEMYFSVWGTSGLIYYDGQKVIEKNIFSPLGIDYSRYCPDLIKHDDKIYILVEREKNDGNEAMSQVVIYDLASESAVNIPFPSVTRIYQGAEYQENRIYPDKILERNGLFYISSNVGLFTFNGVNFNFYDVMDLAGAFVEEQYINTLKINDFQLTEEGIVLTTNWGILTNDDFTSVAEENPYHVNDFSLYPSMAGQGEIVNIESPEGLAIERIRLISIEGRAVDIPRPAISGGRATLQVPPAALGNYAVVIETEAGAYLKQLIIK